MITQNFASYVEYECVYGRVIAWDLNAHRKMCWNIIQHIVIHKMNNKAQLKSNILLYK